ncbi:hypothetical protein CRE_08337 [Caenorhabditis remanei]|uniref:Uncharacterized protein n=1 Tax=Caenorhabditis remanei TaxID=31234 RepID=E3MPG8_CAERE|nr:hypothetical protein CRE_08337 [Caenorhabditis remanei]
MDLEESQLFIDDPMDPHPAIERPDEERLRELSTISNIFVEGDDGHFAFLTLDDILPLTNAIIKTYTYFGRHITFETIYGYYLEQKERNGGVPEEIKSFHCIYESALPTPEEPFPVPSGRYNSKLFLKEIQDYFYDIRQVLPSPTLKKTEELFQVACKNATNDQKYKVADIEKLLDIAFLTMKQSTTVGFNHHRFVQASTVLFPFYNLIDRLNIRALSALKERVRYYDRSSGLRSRQTSISSVVQGLCNIIIKIQPAQKIRSDPQPHLFPNLHQVYYPVHHTGMPYGNVNVDINQNHVMANGPQHPELANGGIVPFEHPGFQNFVNPLGDLAPLMQPAVQNLSMIHPMQPANIVLHMQPPPQHPVIPNDDMVPLVQPALQEVELVNGNMVPQMHPNGNMVPQMQPVFQNQEMQWHPHINNGHMVPQLQHPGYANTIEQPKYETVPGYKTPRAVMDAVWLAGQEAVNPEEQIDDEVNAEEEMNGFAMGELRFRRAIVVERRDDASIRAEL